MAWITDMPFAAFTGKALRDGSTVYRSRVTGTRYTIRPRGDGISLYREGMFIQRVSTRSWVFVKMERLDADYAKALRLRARA
jgi:hypothetical protein